MTTAVAVIYNTIRLVNFNKKINSIEGEKLGISEEGKKSV